MSVIMLYLQKNFIYELYIKRFFKKFYEGWINI